MIRSILLGVDGSEHSQTALELGIRWARQANALLVGIGVIDEPAIRHAGAVPLGGGQFKKERDDTLVHEATVRIEQFLSRFAIRCADAGVACKVLEDVGAPAAHIAVEAQRFDLILLGRKTHFASLVQDAPCPTLSQVLHASPRPVVRAPETLDSDGPIVIAYDGSLQAARTVFAFAATGLGENREIHVVSLHQDRVEAARRGDRAIEYLAARGLPATLHADQCAGDEAERLLAAAEKHRAGLLVMGAYGNSLVREFMFGSVTRAVLRDARLPLFLFH
jgi:nucleotide-binding universal stress UspA family protein